MLDLNPEITGDKIIDLFLSYQTTCDRSRIT